MISNINVESFIEQENCYICMEKTYSRSPCECQTPICEDCFQIEKDRRNYNCSICKYDFNDENTLNEFFNPFFDPNISPRKTGLPDIEFMLETKRLQQLEIEREQRIETRRRIIKKLINIGKNIFLKTPLIFGFSIMFGNLILFFKNKNCCFFEINIDIFAQGLLCILFLNVLHDVIYSKCNRIIQPSSFSQIYDNDNQPV
jgi:hypothetical protein